MTGFLVVATRWNDSIILIFSYYTGVDKLWNEFVINIKKENAGTGRV